MALVSTYERTEAAATDFESRQVFPNLAPLTRDNFTVLFVNCQFLRNLKIALRIILHTNTMDSASATFLAFLDTAGRTQT